MKLKQVSNDFNVLFLSENNLWTVGVQGSPVVEEYSFQGIWGRSKFFFFFFFFNNFIYWLYWLQNGMATHSGLLAWKIPRIAEAGGLSPWNRSQSDMTDQLTRWVFMAVQALVAVSRAALDLWRAGCSLWWLLSLLSPPGHTWASAVAILRL